MIQIAIYGKGGIGKSTISANVSYLLAKEGLGVTQIGCDPKHDSTRLLLGGRTPDTVLGYLRRTPPYDRRLDDVVLEGAMGVRCIEAGGPEPGIGCAGRGILSTFDALKKLGLDRIPQDVRLFDVLGDVVCGGFAVPLRKEYSDAVFIVTSGEFMSVYAANNILKGLRNFDEGVPRVAGLILNCRGDEDEYGCVKRFADAVELPIVAVVPRDRLFAESEEKGCTAAELDPDSGSVEAIGSVAAAIRSIASGERELFHPKPLDDQALSCYARGLPVPGRDAGIATAPVCGFGPRPGRTRSDKNRRVVHSCGAAGAVYPLLFLEDAVTILHGPRSCAHIMAASRDMTDIRHLETHLPVSHRLICTAMDDTASIFGGLEPLEAMIEGEIAKGCRCIFVVTTCVSGIIGDDVPDLVRSIGRRHPGVFIRAVMADGNIIGEWERGYIASADELLDLVEEDCAPEKGTVNIIGERYFFKQDSDRSEASDLFRLFGLGINCRFMYRTSIDDIRHLRRGALTFAASDDPACREISDLLANRLGISVEHERLPIGMTEFERFAERMAGLTGDRTASSLAISNARRRYGSAIASCSRRLKGRRILVVDKFTPNIDWLLELLEDAGASVIKIGLGAGHATRAEGSGSRYQGRLIFVDDYGIEQLKDDVELLRPDAVLTDSSLMLVEGQRRMVYSTPSPGIDGVILYSQRLSDLMILPASEGWRCTE